MMEQNDEVSPSPPASPVQTQQQPQQHPQQHPQQQVNTYAMSPGPHNLNYHQQQQLHQRHIQRTGGLQRLTADLAGLQFNDVEALFKIPAPSVKHRDRRKSKKPAENVCTKHATETNRQEQQQHQAGPSSPIQVDFIVNAEQKVAQQQQQQQHHAHSHSQAQDRSSKLVKTDREQQQQQTQQQVPANLAAYEEQMTVAQINSQNGPDFDPVKDAQETAEDAQLLKRFKLIALVGTGNYARVYKIMTQHGREVACKAINLSKTSENYKQKFLPRELTILKTVSHANICKTHEIFQYADRVFILMQFCSRGTIADLLYKLGPFSENVTRNFFVQIMDAVSYLHNLDYAHRDLKVENILLDNDFAPKLTDFSYSVCTSHTSNDSSSSKYSQSKSHQSLSPKHQQQQQHQNTAKSNVNKPPNAPTQQRASPTFKLNDTFCGTLPYLSPEMIRLLHYDPKKTDIWSLGVCLYVMLNDRLPFPFNDIKQMIRKQLTKDYKFKTSVEYSDHVKELVSSMLEPEFSRRISSQEVNRHPWMLGAREKPPAN